MARTPHRFQPSTPLPDVLAHLNDNFDTIDDQDLTKITKNGNTPTMLYGYQSGGFKGNDYGLKIAKPGVDVTKATDDQLIFSSAFDVFKIVATGQIVVTKPANFSTSGVVSVAHGLSIVPSVLAYMYHPSSSLYWPTPYMQVDMTTGVCLEQSRVSVEGTNVNFEINTPNTGSNALYTASFSRTFRYYLLQETAN